MYGMLNYMIEIFYIDSIMDDLIWGNTLSA